MPSDQHWNKDITAEFECEIRKKQFLVPITTEGGSIHLRRSFDILIEGGLGVGLPSHKYPLFWPIRIDFSKTLNIVKKYEEYGYKIHWITLIFSIICMKNLVSKFCGGSKHQLQSQSGQNFGGSKHPLSCNRDKIPDVERFWRIFLKSWKAVFKSLDWPFYRFLSS